VKAVPDTVIDAFGDAAHAFAHHDPDDELAAGLALARKQVGLDVRPAPIVAVPATVAASRALPVVAGRRAS
jgi:hypothetical protein